MSDLEPISLILTSVGTEQQAVEISEELILRRLATCVNMVPCQRSIYRWKGKVCEDTEYILLVKAPTSLFERVCDAIRELHSYELPEILSFSIDQAEKTFHEWILRMATGASADEEEAEAEEPVEY
ncbi:MAG: divalent-cation tolerance protein CutA [Acidobacteria bacterium]|jgi:periplasmic divalent cation tolerance protein|nr:divalent-cation tolerance protein CutA [Acidobacteriota bacterium]